MDHPIVRHVAGSLDNHVSAERLLHDYLADLDGSWESASAGGDVAEAALLDFERQTLREAAVVAIDRYGIPRVGKLVDGPDGPVVLDTQSRQ